MGHKMLQQHHTTLKKVLELSLVNKIFEKAAHCLFNGLTCSLHKDSQLFIISCGTGTKQYLYTSVKKGEKILRSDLGG